MKKLFMVICLVSSLSAWAQEWKPLFNGKDMQNWAHAVDGKFVIEDGMLKTEGGMGLLWCTPQKWRTSA